jgi:hypothetical protein
MMLLIGWRLTIGCINNLCHFLWYRMTNYNLLLIRFPSSIPDGIIYFLYLHLFVQSVHIKDYKYIL